MQLHRKARAHVIYYALQNEQRSKLNKFSIQECQILWYKKVKVPKKYRQQIIGDLKDMSGLIEEAMNYTKKRHERETEIRYCLNTEDDAYTYFLAINYELGIEGWSIHIYRISDFPEDYIGDIVSEKWSLCQMFNDEDYRAPETI